MSMTPVRGTPPRAGRVSPSDGTRSTRATDDRPVHADRPTSRCLRAQVLWRVREQRHVAGPLERGGQHPLVTGARAGLAARLDLGALAEVAAEAVDLLVVDALGLVDAEVADLAATPIAVVVRRLAAGSWACHLVSVPR